MPEYSLQQIIVSCLIAGVLLFIIGLIVGIDIGSKYREDDED